MQIDGTKALPGANPPGAQRPASAPAAQPAPAPANDLPHQGAPRAAEVAAAVDGINRYLRSVNQTLRFEVDQSTGKDIVRVVDDTTGDVVRQIPSEEALAVARALSKTRGFLLNQSA
jgi:flagellar protein FlaG